MRKLSDDKLIQHQVEALKLKTMSQTWPKITLLNRLVDVNIVFLIDAINIESTPMSTQIDIFNVDVHIAILEILAGLNQLKHVRKYFDKF